MNLKPTRMEPSSEMLQAKRFQRRKRLGRPLMINVKRLILQERAILTSSEPGGEESSLIPKIPLPVLAESLSAEFKRRTQLRSILPLMIQSKQSLLIGSSTSKYLKLKCLTVYLMLSGIATTTAQVTKQNSWGGQNVMSNSKNWQALLGATVLYVAFVQSMRQ
nr:hypothetical protein [Cherry necrotic rusty mottle virus]